MALGILGGVALMGFYFKPYPTVSHSVNESYSSIFNDPSVPSSFFCLLNYSSTQLDRCIVFPLRSGDRGDAASLCVSI